MTIPRARVLHTEELVGSDHAGGAVSFDAASFPNAVLALSSVGQAPRPADEIMLWTVQGFLAGYNLTRRVGGANHVARTVASVPKVYDGQEFSGATAGDTVINFTLRWYRTPNPR
jgi:hypothetical protein